MARALFFAFAFCLIMALTGCGNTASSGPSTHVEIGSIEADLPGTEWHKAGTANNGQLVTETWENTDRSMFYRVSSDPNETIDGSAVLEQSVNTYMRLMNYPPSSQAKVASLAGRTGVRLEAVRPEPDAYHLVEYIIVAGYRQYYIGMGATNSSWTSGGEDRVYAIVDTIKTKQAGR